MEDRGHLWSGRGLRLLVEYSTIQTGARWEWNKGTTNQQSLASITSIPVTNRVPGSRLTSLIIKIPTIIRIF